jgi:hypothetical protein
MDDNMNPVCMNSSVLFFSGRHLAVFYTPTYSVRTGTGTCTCVDTLLYQVRTSTRYRTIRTYLRVKRSDFLTEYLLVFYNLRTDCTYNTYVVAFSSKETNSDRTPT